MATVKHAINKEIDQRLLAIEGQQTIDLLPLDIRKGNEMYFAGPPELIYVRLPSGASMRIGLIDTGILSTEMMTYPERFRVKVEGPYYKLPTDPKDVVSYGELIRVEDPTKTKKEADPMIPNPILGYYDTSQVVKTIEMGSSSVKIGDKGDVQITSQGEAIKTFNHLIEISKKPENTTVMFGGDMKTLFKNSFLGEILPKSFIPPMNTPNWLINSSIFTTAATLLNEAIDIAQALKKV